MARQFVRFLAGPLVFAVCYFVAPDELSRSGQLALATFAWALAWWVAQPIPWGITALLPLIIFPALGVMKITSTASLYWQPIIVWVMGVALLGYAMQKHGLAKRFAIGLLRIRGVGSSTHRLLFFYMLAAGILSSFISNAAVGAMLMPIGASMLSYIRTLSGQSEVNTRSPLGNFIALGTLYAAMAGGVATVAGDYGGVDTHRLCTDIVRISPEQIKECLEVTSRSVRAP